MTITVPSYNPILFEGLSTDTKPDTWAAPGQKEQAVPLRSTFLETDTGDEYYYTGTKSDDSDEWVKYKANGKFTDPDLTTILFSERDRSRELNAKDDFDELLIIGKFILLHLEYITSQTFKETDIED